MLASRPYKAAFFTEVGPRLGWGHYVRSQALAAEMVAGGVQVNLYVTGVLPKLHHEICSPFVVDQRGLDALNNLGDPVHIVVVDLSQVSADIFKELRDIPVVVCIDDRATSPFDGDILVHPNVNEASPSHTAPHTAFLHGGNYVILRPQFDQVPRRRCRRHASHVLVAFGGTDPVPLTQDVVSTLKHTENLPFQRITVLVGDTPMRQTIMHMVHGDDRFKVLHSVANIRALLCEADIGIIAAGTMLYEAAATGLPALVIPLNALQSREARVLAEKGAVRTLSPTPYGRTQQLRQELYALEDPPTRQRMATAAQALIDGHGRRRVSEAIMQCAMSKLEGKRW